MTTELQTVDGMLFDHYHLPYFVTDPERMECILEDAYVLVHEKKIGNMRDILPLLEQIARAFWQAAIDYLRRSKRARRWQRLTSS